MTTPVGGPPIGQPSQPADISKPPEVLPKGYDQIVDFYKMQGATYQEKIQFVNSWIQQNVTIPMNKTLKQEHERAKALAPFYRGEDDFPELPPR